MTRQPTIFILHSTNIPIFTSLLYQLIINWAKQELSTRFLFQFQEWIFYQNCFFFEFNGRKIKHLSKKSFASYIAQSWCWVGKKQQSNSALFNLKHQLPTSENLYIKCIGKHLMGVYNCILVIGIFVNSDIHDGTNPKKVRHIDWMWRQIIDCFCIHSIRNKWR